MTNHFFPCPGQTRRWVLPAACLLGLAVLGLADCAPMPAADAPE